MDKQYYKKVLWPIVVAAGTYCHGREDGVYRCCGHFDNEGGHPRCTLGIGDSLKYDEEGQVKKSLECLQLQEVIS